MYNLIDINYGLTKEQEIINLLIKFFKRNIYKINDEYFEYDFKDNENNYYELKSRRNVYNKYPSTIIGFNKIEYALKNTENNYYFIFHFLDGTYYYKYNENDNQCFIKEGGRNDRGKKEYKNYYYIPITKLKPIII